MQACCAPLVSPCGAHAHRRDGKRPDPVKEFCGKLLKTHSPFYTYFDLTLTALHAGRKPGPRHYLRFSDVEPKTCSKYFAYEHTVRTGSQVSFF